MLRPPGSSGIMGTSKYLPFPPKLGQRELWVGRRRVTSRRQQCLAQGATTQQHWKSGETSWQLHPLGQGRGNWQSFTLVPRIWSLGHAAERQGRSTLQNQRAEVHPEGLEGFFSACRSLEECGEDLVQEILSRKQQRGQDLQENLQGGEMAKTELEFCQNQNLSFLVFSFSKPELQFWQNQSLRHSKVREEGKRKRAA